MPLQVGDPAPDFTLPDDTGTQHRLADYRGRWVVLYFYPKDMTPGCTVEAQGFRDAYSELQQEGAVVIGISADPPERHQQFRAKHNLPFILLSDPEHKVLEAYEAWGPKKIFGKTTVGPLRKTYIIDPEGRIAKIYPKVRPSGHAEEVLEDLRRLKAERAAQTPA